MLLGIFIICLMWCVPAITAVSSIAIFGTVVGGLLILSGLIRCVASIIELAEEL